MSKIIEAAKKSRIRSWDTNEKCPECSATGHNHVCEFCGRLVIFDNPQGHARIVDTIIVPSIEQDIPADSRTTSEPENKKINYTSAIYCEHANEVPAGKCPCPEDCYCKQHSCKRR
jgi:hypothetical protein